MIISLKRASSNLLVGKIKSRVAFKMSELVMTSKDGFPYSNAWVKEESVISNNLQSTFVIVLRREDHCCKWDNGARNSNLIQLQCRTYIMDSANLENYV